MERFLQDAGPGTPIFIFLSPGLDVAGTVEALGRKLGYTIDNGKYNTVSLGQVRCSMKRMSLQTAMQGILITLKLGAHHHLLHTLYYKHMHADNAQP